MGFSSLDDLVSEVTVNGKFHRQDWNKIIGAAAYTAGRWYDLSPLNGTPVGHSWSGSNLAFQNTTESSGFGIRHGGNVSTDTKHILNMMGVTAASAGVPSVLMLCDMQGYWPGVNLNTASAQNLTGTPGLRYTNGTGCRLYWVAQNTTGANATNLTMNYTNSTGTTGRTLPVSVAMTASAITPHIAHSGTAANNYGPFLPLANGDTGVQNVTNVTFTAASTGIGALVLTKPLATLPLVTASVAAERDLLNQLPSLPQVKDDACLVLLHFAGAATNASSNIYGAVEFGWG